MHEDYCKLVVDSMHFAANLCFLNKLKHLDWLSGMELLQLCSRIEATRIELGFSRERLAELLDVSATTILRWEKGENKPFFADMVKLSEISGKSLAFFAGLEEAPSLKASLEVVGKELGFEIKPLPGSDSTTRGYGEKISQLNDKNRNHILKSIEQMLSAQESLAAKKKTSAV